MVEMQVVIEDGNRFDPNAMKVMMLPLHAIPAELSDAITRPGDARLPVQTVRGLAGRQVG